MSIRDQIQKLIDNNELFCLESEMTGDETVRALFVSREVLDAVTPPFNEYHAILLSEFRSNLDAFLEGGEISVAENPYEKKPHALMARVAPVENEFWDLRVTAPQPQIRAFGGFAEKDTFVLLTWNYRDSIGNNFDAEVDRCRIAWQQLFGNTAPYSGTRLDDYLTNYIPV